MKKLYYLILCIFFLPWLMGCKEKYNYSYYMQHPHVLKDVVASCQVNENKTKEQSAQCEIAFSATTAVLTLIDEQQSHPEAFGQRIMDEEINYAKLTDTVNKAQLSLHLLEKKSATNAEIRVAQDDLYKARKARDEQWQQIKILLAVLGLSSPE